MNTKHDPQEYSQAAREFAEKEVSRFHKLYPGLPSDVLDRLRAEVSDRFIAINSYGNNSNGNYFDLPYTAQVTLPKDRPIVAWHTLDKGMKLANDDGRQAVVGETLSVGCSPILYSVGLHGGMRLVDTLLSYGWRDSLCKVSLFGEVEVPTSGLVAATHRRVDEAYPVREIITIYLFDSAMNRLGAVENRLPKAKDVLGNFVSRGCPKGDEERITKLFGTYHLAVERQLLILEQVLLPEIYENGIEGCEESGEWPEIGADDFNTLKEYTSAVFALKTVSAALTSLQCHPTYSQLRPYWCFKELSALRARKALEAVTLPGLYRARYGYVEDFPKNWLGEESKALEAAVKYRPSVDYT